MSMTLGEKLRQAREARGFSISEVAEQTRISALYLESIENDDYKILPGGIFNKGFIKSYAKYVGVDEKEALADYQQQQIALGQIEEDKPTTRPEVLTDDRQSSTSAGTIIFAVIITGVLIGGVLLVMRFLSGNEALSPDTANLNANANTVAVSTPTPAPSPTFSGAMEIELKTVNAPVWIASVADGKRAGGIVAPGKPLAFKPQESLRLSYSKDQAANVQLTMNGKQIALPTAPANPKQNAVEFTITRETAAQIFQSGAITSAGATPATAAPRR